MSCIPLFAFAATNTLDLPLPPSPPPTHPGSHAGALQTFDEIYADYKNSSDQLLSVRKELVAIAESFGLKHTSYEAGPGWNVGNENSLGNYIIAQRLAPMRDVWKYDLLNSWAAAGGDIYHQFSLFGEVRACPLFICALHATILLLLVTSRAHPAEQYSRFGMWGSAENFFNTSTPKVSRSSSSSFSSSRPSHPTPGWQRVCTHLRCKRRTPPHPISPQPHSQPCAPLPLLLPFLNCSTAQ
jgi:hypothetical protein